MQSSVIEPLRKANIISSHGVKVTTAQELKRQQCHTSKETHWGWAMREGSSPEQADKPTLFSEGLPHIGQS